MIHFSKGSVMGIVSKLDLVLIWGPHKHHGGVMIPFSFWQPVVMGLFTKDAKRLPTKTFDKGRQLFHKFVSYGLSIFFSFFLTIALQKLARTEFNFHYVPHMILCPICLLDNHIFFFFSFNLHLKKVFAVFIDNGFFCKIFLHYK